MDEQDRHIHVEAKVLRNSAATRNILASTFALAERSPEHRHRRMRPACAVRDDLRPPGERHLPALP